MFSLIRSLFREILNEGSDNGTIDAPSIQLAMASLLCEVSRADRAYDQREEKAKIHLLTQLLDIDDASATALLNKAVNRTENSISLFDFTNKLRNFSEQERFELIKAMWQVAYADDVLDPNEEAIIRQVADLIYVDHTAFIRAKHDALALKNKV